MKAVITGDNAVGRSTAKFYFLSLLVFIVFCLLGPLYYGDAAQTLGPPVFSVQLKESLPLIHADQVHQLGITGEGIGVAIVDIFAPNPNDPCRSAHGLWIEGIIKAVAPGANLERFDVRTVPGNQPRTCYLMSNSDINQALRQILNKHKQLGIRVLNLSWGGGQYANPCRMRRSETSDLLQKIVDQGIAVIAAAGNEGFQNALIWPACLPAAISVGASFDYDSQRPERTSICEQEPVVDQITCYSNTASFLDVVAPGSRASVSPQLSGLGTSASTAYASGVVALLLQADDTLSPSDVRHTLSETGKAIVDPRNGLTFPRVDALSAVKSVLPKMSSAPQPAVQKGDVNQDGQVDSKDILELLSALGGLLELDEVQAFAADVALPCDGDLNLADLNVLRTMALRRARTQCVSTTATSAFPSGAIGLNLQAVHAISFLQQVRFQIQGSGVETAQVLVFDLSGKRLYDSGMTSPTALAWKLTTERGQRVSNGVYLYVVRVRGSGTEKTSAVHKLAVVR